LSDTGDDNSLKQRLRSYYGIENSGADSDVTASGGTRIVIESARRSEYFNVTLDSNVSESIIRLSGEVLITVSEPDRDRVHRVEADTVIFNQEVNTISALGNIRYTVDTGGREEHFSGDSLTFEVSNWTGVIFRGTSERQQEIDGQSVDFFFRGESIKRSGPDILVLSNGVITSHDDPNPDYALKADKIWITGPGEWGLLSATLYVGHVPVLYLPFYWKSGSDMLFNPVIGFRSRVGYYMQTTTYLMGKKEDDDGFSIMGFGDSASTGYNLERDGLFLVRSSSSDSEKPIGNNTLKYMLDIYTSLGALTGFYGEFPAMKNGGSLDFYATIGVSRSIDSNGSIYFNDAGSSKIFWNSSYLGNKKIPFRWGSKVDYSQDRWSIYMDWYSDPYYLEDFGNRKENFDWLSFLLGEEGTDQNDPDLVTDMRWEISGSESVSPEGTAPWLQTLSMDSFRTSLTWKNKTNTDITGSGSPDANYDPARNFYYPDKLILPDIKLSLKGGSPQWTVNRHSEPESLSTATHENDDDKDMSSGPDPAPYEDSFDAVYSTGLLTASMNYGLQTQLFIEDQTNSTAWLAPSDIDFVFNAARINTTQRGDLSWNLDFWDGFTGISGATNLSGYYQIHADIFANDAVISDTTRLEDYQYSKLLWDNRVSMYLMPFQGIPSLSTSSLKYNLDAKFFSRHLSEGATASNPEYQNSWISGKDDFRQHEAA
ncbi:MAG: LPS-assembly protein LptD, partial [Spirochaetaceae bacterium]|nr:LPS-assembly protein LptD [Spirochaetaceae bacterium]